MAHHAFFRAGTLDEGVEAALSYGERVLGLPSVGNPDVITLRYGLFSVADARRVISLAEQGSVTGDKKLIIIRAGRVFHEAQNALLKLFEEPVAGTTLVLVVPSAGMVLPTLRSRMLPLPEDGAAHASSLGMSYLRASNAEREKMLAKMLERTKSDKDEEKQEARIELLTLAESILATAHTAWRKSPTPELTAFITDMDHFIPIFHERSAPLKLIFEHVQLTMPKL